jgi:hypothetical protein
MKTGTPEKLAKKLDFNLSSFSEKANKGITYILIKYTLFN